MANTAIVKINGFRSLQVLLAKLSGGFGSKKLMAEIATFLITSIKLRTARGEDVAGQMFEPYSAKYSMFRSKKGHPVDKVSLFFTGSMMSSMDYTATKKKAFLFFQNTEDKFGSKNPLKAYYLNEKREFFAISEEDQREVENMVDDYIKNELRS